MLAAARSDRVQGTVLVVALTASLVTVAYRAEGYSSTATPLNDGGVWTTRLSEGALGRLNSQTESIDTTLALAGQFDVLQSDADVLVHDEKGGRLSFVDVRRAQTVATAQLPAKARVALGGGTAAVLDAEGHLWLGSAAEAAGRSYDDTPPSAEVKPGSLVAVGVDGFAYVLEADEARVRVFPPTAAELPSLALAGRPAKPEIAAVGQVPVVLDTEARQLFMPGARPVDVSDAGTKPRLQLSGYAGDSVLVAGDDALLDVPLDATGTVRRVAKGSGGAVRPVAMGACVYAAWQAKPSYAQSCGGRGSANELLAGVRAGSSLVFRVNRGRVVLNERVGGANFLFTQDKPKRIDDWDEALQTQSQVDKDDNRTRTVDEEIEQEASKINRPPSATDDIASTRPGRPVLLRPLRNDVDADGDVLVIDALPPLPKGTGTAAVVDGGQAIQYTPPPGRAGRSTFPYRVTDGRGGQASARVTVSLTAPPANAGPKPRQDRLVMEAGRSLTVDVLANDEDPENDALSLVAVTADQGAVQFRPDGKVTYTAPGGGARTAEVAYVVVDEYSARAEGLLVVDIRAPGNIRPTARNDAAVTTAGRPAELKLLTNDTDPNDDALSVVRVDSDPRVEVTWRPDGSFRFLASRPGSYPLTYEVSDGTTTDEGLVRVDVRRPGRPSAPVAVRDDIVLRPSVPTPIPVLANDIDADGDVLVVQQMEGVGEVPGLVVEVLDRSVLRVTATSPLPGPASFRYVVNDGTAQAVGTVLLRPAPSSGVDQPPAAVRDEVVVRAGNATAIRVLANDSDPENSPLSLVGVKPIASADGEVFVQGNEVRYRAPAQERGSVTTPYTVRDGAGNRADGLLVVHVVPADGTRNTAPQPDLTQVRTFLGKAVAVPLRLVGMDPEGDPVTLLGVVQPPARGQVDQVGPATLRYSPDAGATGTDRFTYRVRDSYGAEAQGTVEVGVVPLPTVNSAPVAVADNVTVGTGLTARVDVLRNDSDPDADPIALAAGPDAVGQARIGAVSVRDGGVFFTAPADARDGVVSFDYGVVDDRGGYARGLVTVRINGTVPPKPPVARDDLASPQRQGASVAVDVLANDSDADGDLARSEVTVSLPGAGVRGGKVRFTMPATPVSFSYVLTDAQGQTARAIVQVPLIRNRPPAPSPDEATTEAGKRVRLGVLENDKDPDGDRLTLERVLAPRGGTARLTGGGVVFTPAVGFSGEGGFAYEVSDGKDKAVGAAKVVVKAPPKEEEDEEIPTPDEPQNRPPVVAVLPLQLAAGRTVTVDLARAASDPDPGDRLSFSALSGSSPGIVVGLSGTRLTVTTDDEAGGRSATYSYTVSDGKPRGAARGSVPVTVLANDKPLPQASADRAETVQGAPVVIDVLANDTDPVGKGLRLVSVGAAEGGAGSVDGGRVRFAPSADFFGATTFSYVVADATGDARRQATGSVSVSVVGRPSAPPAPRGTVSNRTVDLTWGVPPANGAPISEYKLEDDAGGSRSCPSNSCRVDTLTNGKDYRFRVLAVNRAGDGAWSAWTDVLTPDALPGVPGSPSATFGDKQVSVSWAAPANEGSPVTEYTLQVSPPGSGGGSLSFPASTTSTVVTGLANGTAYSFRVRATNRAGSSEYGGTSAPETPAGVPATPGAPSATRGDNQLSVAWSGTEPNGDPVVAWEVLIFKSGAAAGTQAVAEGGARAATVTAQNSSSYTFRVRARNKAGWSEASALSAPVVPAGKPLTISGVSATEDDGASTLAFTAPGDNGAPITGYEVSINGAGGAALTADRTLRGLANGTTYRFAVRACNDVGCGDFSPQSNAVVPFGAPEAPVVGASVSGRTITWNWNVPNGNGRPVDGFVVTLDGAQVQGGMATSFAREFGYSENHVVQVFARNSGGKTGSSGTAGASTPPPPTPPSVSVGKGASYRSASCTHSSCAYVAVSIRDFGPGQGVRVQCHSSRGTFYEYTVTTNGAGHHDSQVCFYGFPGDAVWATAYVRPDLNARSNNITW